MPMILKEAKCVDFEPRELHPGREPQPPGRMATPSNSVASFIPPRNGHDLMSEVERLVRENERLTIERDELRDQLSRQSLEVRRAKIVKLAKDRVSVDPGVANSAGGGGSDAPLLFGAGGHVHEPLSPLNEEAGLAVARIVASWFWPNAGDAHVRMVRDALAGRGLDEILARYAEGSGR